MNYSLKNTIVALFSITTGMLCAMETTIYDPKEAEKIFGTALKNDDTAAMNNLFSRMNKLFESDKFNSYRSFLQTAAFYDKENIFKFLLTEDPFKCLNTPKHDGNYSEPITIYDALNNPFYLPEKTIEKYLPIAASYGAKSVKQLQQEGVSSAFPVRRYHGMFSREIND
jgi:hypothetical protein